MARSRALGIFRALVRLFPAEFQRDYGADMEWALRASLAEAVTRSARLRVWAQALGDLAVSLPREHWDTWIGDGRGWTMEGIIQDVRRAMRTVARGPAFAAVVILTVGLGVGATTTVYSVVHGVLLAPLPYPDPDRIVAISEYVEATGSSVSMSYVNGRDWKAAQSTLEGIALVRGGGLTLARAEGAVQVSALFADAEYFDIYGARPAVGRLFGVEENRVPGGHPIAVLSHEAWQRLFGGAREVVGSTVSLSGAPYTVVGVLSRDFREPFPGANGAGNDVILPAMMAGQVDPRGDEVVTERRWRTFSAVGKLRPGVAVAAAEADLRGVAARLEEVSPINRGMSASVLLFSESTTQAIRDPALLLLIGAVVLLFLACFNVANLLMVRGSSRTGEMAAQLALGAERGRLFRILTAEGLLMSMAGGALGLFAAWLALPVIHRLTTDLLPPTADVRMSVPVVAAAAAVSLLAGAGFSVLPALRLGGTDLRSSFSSGLRTVGDRKSDRVRHGLVLFEIATATTLLAASALLVSSFRELASADSGFETENVLTMRLNLPSASYPDDASMARAAEQIAARVAAIPDVLWAHPWGPGRPGLVFNFQTSVPDHVVVEEIGEAPLSRRHQVTPGALEDMGLELVSGRTIERSDRADAPFVAVVSESLAEELWPNEDPIGKRYHAFQAPGAPIPPNRHWTVIGVVRDALHGGRVPPPGGILTDNDSYFPIAQWPERAFTLLVKTSGPPSLGPVQDAVRAFDPNIPIFQVATMRENFAQEEGTAKFAAELMGGFGLAGLLLATLGVYGVVSFAVTRRTREIGLRVALGEDRRTTLYHVLRQGGKLAGAGVALGTAAAFAAARGLAAVLPNTPSMDGYAVATAAGLLVIVVVLSTLIPAVRATRIEPVVALKSE